MSARRVPPSFFDNNLANLGSRETISSFLPNQLISSRGVVIPQVAGNFKSFRNSLMKISILFNMVRSRERTRSSRRIRNGPLPMGPEAIQELSLNDPGVKLNL